MLTRRSFVPIAFAAGTSRPAAARLPPRDHISCMVFFGSNNPNLSQFQAGRVQACAKDIQNALPPNSDALVHVYGHTDTAEDDRLVLSQRRADVVKDELVRYGMLATTIVAKGLGDTDLLVKTKEGVAEPQNRIAVIYVKLD